jgi:hypothetical protein
LIGYETDLGALGYGVFLWILGVSRFSDRWAFVLVWVVEITGSRTLQTIGIKEICHFVAIKRINPRGVLKA